MLDALHVQIHVIQQQGNVLIVWKNIILKKVNVLNVHKQCQDVQFVQKEQNVKYVKMDISRMMIKHAQIVNINQIVTHVQEKKTNV